MLHTHACSMHSRALQPLVDAGFVEVAYGDKVQGQYLCNHDLVAHIHLTGSADTYDVMVWGDKRHNKVLIHIQSRAAWDIK